MTSNSKGFDFRIDARPDFSFLTVKIPAGETLKVEASAMAAMDTNLKMKTRFTAEGGAGELSVAPGAPGDIQHVYLDNQTIFLQNTAFVASSTTVNVETKWQGITKGFFSGESFFLIRCSGQGDLWFNTFGAMVELDGVNDDLVVDTGHVVAFTEGLEYSISRLGGYKSLFLSGEGLVCRFRGQGKVWIQTRKIEPFAAWMSWFRPVKKKN
jgi:uncharacterized protein (TIGR00266 family)